MEPEPEELSTEPATSAFWVGADIGTTESEPGVAAVTWSGPPRVRAGAVADVTVERRDGAEYLAVEIRERT